MSTTNSVFYVKSSMTIIVSPILKERHKEYRNIHIMYNPNARMRRLTFEIQRHFFLQSLVIYERKLYTEKNELECALLRVKTLGNFENYLYNLKFKKIGSGILDVDDIEYGRYFATLKEYLVALPHFQKSFFDDNDTIIKNVDELK